MDSFHARQARSKPARSVVEAVRNAAASPRADLLLVERGLADSRTAAQRLIAAGRVRWYGPQGLRTVSKASENLPDSAELEVIPDESDRFVSRGGLKLVGALARTGLDAFGACCLDVGQSTGGFTDCLLQAGAVSVVGVEVGHDQLHPRLRTDPRNVTLEGINARGLQPAVFGQHYPVGGFDLIACDASFISLTLLLPCWPGLLAEAGKILALVKPQFEVGPQGLGRGGIVRDAALYAGVEQRVRTGCGDCGLIVLDWFDSPIRGGDGNREFFILAGKAGT